MVERSGGRPLRPRVTRLTMSPPFVPSPAPPHVTSYVSTRLLALHLLLYFLSFSATPCLALTWDRPLGWGTAQNGLAYSTAASFPLTADIYDQPLPFSSPLSSANDTSTTASIIVLFGGYEFDGDQNANIHWILWPADQNGLPAPAPYPLNWRRAITVGSAPTGRSYHASVSLHPLGGNLRYKFLTYGGGDSAQAYSSLWVYDLQSNRWSGLGPPPADRVISNAACLSLQSQIIYGFATQSYACTVDQCANFTASTANMDSNGCPWPMARAGHTFTLVPAANAAYVYGGALQSGDFTGDLWKLDLSRGDALNGFVQQMQLQRLASKGCYASTDNTCPIKWTQLTLNDLSGRVSSSDPVTPGPRAFHMATAVGRLLVILGGTYDWYDVTLIRDSLYVFHTKELYWRQITVTPSTFKTTSGAGILDRSGASLLPITRRFNSQQAPDDFYDITSSSICNPNVRFVLIGGSSSKGREDSVYSFSAPINACSNGTFNRNYNVSWSVTYERNWTNPTGYVTHLYGPTLTPTQSGRSLFIFGGHTVNQQVSANSALYHYSQQVIQPVNVALPARLGDVALPNACRDSVLIAAFVASGAKTPSSSGCPFPWPAPRYYHSVTTLGNRLYLYGGLISANNFGSSASSSELWSLNILTHDWTLYGGLLFAGNIAGNVSASANSSSSLWPWSTYSALLGTTVRDPQGSLILWSGLDPTTFDVILTQGACFEFSFTTNTWKDVKNQMQSNTIAPANLTKAAAYRSGAQIKSSTAGPVLFPLERSNVAYAANEDQSVYYFFGGYSARAVNPTDPIFTALGTTVSNDVWSLRMSNLSWTRLKSNRYYAPFTPIEASFASNVPLPRYAADMTYDSSSSCLFVTGGFYDQYAAGHDYKVMKDLWCFYLPTRGWRNIPVPIGFTARESASVGMLHNRLYIVNGGGEAFAQVAFDNWEFEPETGTWTQLSSSGISGREGAPAVIFPNLNQLVYFGGIVVDVMSELHTLHVDDAIVSAKPDQLRHDVLTSALTRVGVPSMAGLSDAHVATSAFATIAGAVRFYQSMNVGLFRLQVESDETIDSNTQTGLTKREDDVAVSSNTTSVPSVPSTVGILTQRIMTGIHQVNFNQSIGIRGASSSSSAQISTQRVLLDCSIAAAESTSCITVTAGAALQLSNVALRSGSSPNGAAISASSASLDLVNVHLLSHTAAQHGGAVFAMDTNVVIRGGSVLEDSHATQLGGGMYAVRSTMQLNDSIFRGNTIRSNTAGIAINTATSVSEGSGGAIFGLSCSLAVTNCTFLSNTAKRGGAISVDALISDSFVAELLQLHLGLQIDGSQFENNVVTEDGGALYLSQLDSTAAPTISNSNFIANEAGEGGGAIYLYHSLMAVSNSDFNRNSVSNGGGGAVFWESMGVDATSWSEQPTFQFLPNRSGEELANDNYAKYGSWIATQPTAYEIVPVASSTGPTEDLTQPVLQKSGLTISRPFQIRLLDYFGSLVAVDNSSLFTMEPSVSLQGASSVRVTQGVATFDSFILLVEPTANQTFTFSPSVQLSLLEAVAEERRKITFVSIPCIPGEYVSDRRCQSCKAGEFSNISMSSLCNPCPAGSYSSEQGASRCQLCSEGTASSIIGLGSECPFCAVDSFAFGVGAIECTACDSGIRCGYGQAVAEAGSWIVRPVADETGYSAQPYSIVCPYANCPGDGECGVNRMNPPEINPLCGMCQPGYIESSHSCIKCDTPQAGLLVIVIICTIILVVILHRFAREGVGETEIVFYFVQTVVFQAGGVSTWLGWLAFLDLAPTKATSGVCVYPMTNYQEMALDLFGPFFLVVVLLFLFCLHMLIRCLPCGSTVCTHQNRIGKWFGEQDPLFSPDNRHSAVAIRKSIFSRTSFALDVKIKESNEPDGLLSPSANGRFANTSPSPMSSPSSVSLSSSPSAAASASPSERIRFVYGSYVRTLFNFYLLSYQQVSTVALGHLACVDTGISTVVFVSPTMDCSSSTYQQWRIVWILFVIIWVFGGPLSIFLFLRRHQSRITSGDRQFSVFFGILHEGYQKHCYWYVSFVLFRRVVFVVLDVFLQSLLAIKICAFIIWNWFILLVHLRIAPYESQVNHIHATASLTAISLISTLLMLGLQKSKSQLQLSIAEQVIVSVLFFVPLVWMLVRIGYGKTQRFVEKTLRRRKKSSPSNQPRHLAAAAAINDSDAKQIHPSTERRASMVPIFRTRSTLALESAHPVAGSPTFVSAASHVEQMSSMSSSSSPTTIPSKGHTEQVSTLAGVPEYETRWTPPSSSIDAGATESMTNPASPVVGPSSPPSTVLVIPASSRHASPAAQDSSIPFVAPISKSVSSEQQSVSPMASPINSLPVSPFRTPLDIAALTLKGLHIKIGTESASEFVKRLRSPSKGSTEATLPTSPIQQITIHPSKGSGPQPIPAADINISDITVQL